MENVGTQRKQNQNTQGKRDKAKGRPRAFHLNIRHDEEVRGRSLIIKGGKWNDYPSKIN